MIKAKKGANASWMWSSMPKGIDVMTQGAVWQIKDGESIKVWEDPWIPGLKTHRSNAQEKENINWNLCVNDLINK